MPAEILEVRLRKQCLAGYTMDWNFAMRALTIVSAVMVREIE
jgi:hypothetical protein